MRKLIPSLLFLMFLTSFLWGQKTLSKPEYEKIVDELNCSVASFLIEKKEEKTIIEAYKNSVQFCDFVTLMEFLKKSQPQFERNAIIATEIEQQKALFDSLDNNLQLYNRLTDVLRNEVVMGEWLQNPNFQPFKDEVLKELEKKMKTQEVDIIEEQESENAQSWQRYLTLPNLLLLILGVVILVAGRAFFQLFKTPRFSSNQPIATPPATTSVVAPPPTSVPTTTQPLQNEEVENATAETDETPVPRGIVAEDTVSELPQVVQLEPEKEVKEVFFMPAPQIDGSFYEFNKTKQYQQEMTVFRFELVSEKYGLARFYVENTPEVVLQAIMDFEAVLKPACDVKNSLTSKTMEIKTLKPGIVKLSGNHWRLQTKAIVEFI